MIDPQLALDVRFKNTSGLDIDVKNQMANFSDNQQLASTNVQTIEITYTKALNTVFVYLPVPSAQPVAIDTMTITTSSGTSAPLVFTDFIDGTQGLTQSGFIHWRPPHDANFNFQTGATFTYTFNYDAEITATFGGINLLFCDKFDLLREYPDLDNLLGLSSDITIDQRLIRIMESTRNEIEEKVKNSDIYKLDRQYFRTTTELDRWDLLQISQLNQAAIFWTLGKIFYFLQDEPGDIYQLKANDYNARAENAFTSINLSVDFNDDGSLDVFQGEREYDNIEITLER